MSMQPKPPQAPTPSSIELAAETPTPVEEVSHMDHLKEMEQTLADCAEEMLNGKSLDHEEQAYLEALNEFENTLEASLEELAETLRDDPSVTMKQLERAMLELAADSQHRVLYTAAFQHAESSIVERSRERLVRTKMRRVLGRVALAGVFGATVWATSKGVDAAVAATIVGSTPYVASAAKGAAKGVVNIFKNRSMSPLKGVDNDEMKQIVEQVAEIDDEEERERERYRLLTEKPMRQVENEMRSVLFDSDLETDLDVNSAIKAIVSISTENLMSYYNLKESQRDKRRKKSAVEIGAEALGAVGAATDLPGLKDAAKEGPKAANEA